MNTLKRIDVSNFEGYRPYLIGKTIKNSKIADAKHENDFLDEKLKIDIYLKNGRIIHALFNIDYFGMVKIIYNKGTSREILFEDNYKTGIEKVYKRLKELNH